MGRQTAPDAWMVALAVDLMIGVVTHTGTRFASSLGESGLAHTLAARLRTEGLAVDIRIHDQDLYAESMLRIDRETISASIDAELAIEARWREYLKPSQPGFLRAPVFWARRLARRRAYLPSEPGPVAADAPGARMVRRLINIELAHLALLEQAQAAKAAWVLILEDDAQASTRLFDAFARGLHDLVRESDQGSGGTPKFVNVSESFALDTLGVSGLLTPCGTWGGDSIAVLSASRPVTNTVCAVLYSRSFVRELLDEYRRIPLAPVIPIDWKLNTALLSMAERGSFGPGECWFLSPGPVIQGSMA